MTAPTHRLAKRLAAALLCLMSAAAIADDQDNKPNQQMQAVLDALGKLGGKPIQSLPPGLARLQPSAADG